MKKLWEWMKLFEDGVKLEYYNKVYKEWKSIDTRTKIASFYERNSEIRIKPKPKKVMNGFYYKGMKFIEVSHNIFHSKKFGNKLIYEYKNGNYHLVRDERLSSVISLDEINSNPNSICNNDYWWK